MEMKKMELKVKANPCFKEVNLCSKRYIVMKGSAGSGKSVDTAQTYILRLMKDKGRNLLCIRKADVTNRDSTFAELQGAIFRIFGDNYSKYWKINSSLMLMEFIPNNNQIIFRGMKDDKQRERLKSITFKRGKLTDVWIEEATELAQSDFEIIDDRLRGELPDGQFYQIRMTFNPVSSNHWIKKQFFDRKDENVLTHHSTYLMNRFIDSAYHKRMERRKEVDPEGYEVYGLGNWGETQGIIFRNWEVKKISLNFDDYDDICYGVDFGFNHANAMLEIGYKDGDIYVLREIYGYERTTDDWIKEAEKANFSKQKRMWADSAEPDRIKMYRSSGFACQPVKKEPNSVQAQISWLKGRKIFIHPKCTNLIKELSQWKWKKDEKSNTYLDEPVPFFDDAIAALRYGVEEWRKDKKIRLNRVDERS